MSRESTCTAAMVALIASIFTWVAALNCNFYSTTTGVDSAIIHTGVWQTDFGDGCMRGGSVTGDGAWMYARVISVITLIFSVPVLACTFFPRMQRPWLAASHLMLGFFTMSFLVLLANSFCYAHPQQCQLRAGGILALLGGALWFISSVIVSIGSYAAEGANEEEGEKDIEAVQEE